MIRLNSHVSKFLPGYITIAAIISFVFPSLFSYFYTSTSVLLGFVLFLTGLSMAFKDLYVLRKSTLVMSTGLILKWTLTVLVSVFLAKLFFSDYPNLVAGFILTGSVPSGTAATMYTFLAGGNTSLVVAMGIVDVFISPVVTPAIMNISANNTVAVSFFELAEKMFFIVVLPIVSGMVVRYFTNQSIHKIKPYTKFASSVTIIFIVLSVVAGVSQQVAIQNDLLALIVITVFFQVFIPMVGGYRVALWLGNKKENAIAILFEVGLCNSALAAILALEFFGETAAVPAVINMIFNLSLGAYFSNRFAKGL
ncbi:bile acid:sodium symporter family protein [Halobacillus shinanisalinarum]|uniref:Bile acid:sodium symporter family protein n=1 Tax=Halobacillus shinanisalinarum TaxID=2932258 RepID=A0ABY4GUS2_9BACI|nr:bile acid:sodium symporter family protein [Halobacillus shinanisalinarum]UOQ91917.1 bile acid:sodium symporter family protein [Halobacillus shinanisalinarum]